MSGAGRTKVAQVAELAEGQARTVEVNGKSIAVFNVAGRYYAIDNLCPHRGGPLAEGDVDGTIVVCPWHGWRWDVTTGANANNPAVTVACYPVTVEQGAIFVGVS
jgi:NAD(P)H-dependent nitrite reductase small subunit